MANAAEQVKVAATPAASPGIDPTSVGRVLLVDKPRFARLLERMLEGHFEMRCAADGVEAVRIVREWSPDAIVCEATVRGGGTRLAELELPEGLVWRQPFPGPGLAVRLIGEITRERVAALQAADRIFREEVAAAGLEREISQYFAALTGIRTVGVMGDSRTYGEVAALRAVTTDDFMTADWFRMPHDVLQRISTRITNSVRGINRVVYDCSSKPPSTIEWE